VQIEDREKEKYNWSREFLPKAEKQNNRHAQPSMREFSQKIIYTKIFFT
jgi:hypothetical protein